MLGFRSEPGTGEEFRSVDPVTGEPFGPGFAEPTPQQIDASLTLASRAHQELKTRSRADRAKLLESIAEGIEQLGDTLLKTAHAETALPLGRLTGERGRTVSQLRMFAEWVREGSYLGVRIDHGDPKREPIPKPDTRLMQIPLGPVVVFGASNFPLAFSVAGGDTASALAAGCPVVCKAHPNHPATSELVAKAIVGAVKALGFPEGTFSLLQGRTNQTGSAMIRHADTKAVAFTGSQRGGLELLRIANERANPIPVYAEMGSVNPMFVFPGALQGKEKSFAEGFYQSYTLGVGQFCTNPGLAFVVKNDPTTRELIYYLEKQVKEAEPGVMLHAGISQSFMNQIEATGNQKGVFGKGADAKPGLTQTTPFLLQVSLEDWLLNKELHGEIFGPATLVVHCADTAAFAIAAAQLEGQLTATIHAGEIDVSQTKPLLNTLEERVGRVLFGGFPTGVEVCHSMQHGGPYPATTDARSTSVGTAAIHRFTRPVCYQNVPESLLPDPVKDNPVDMPKLRLVNGKWSSVADG
ncbi:MAG: aldehyde dehydrogenase (NADP(+)) [Candidatus Eisenbacteria bacterium]|uniref:Aldehyde dehydrogenase (NADP(+)) n=1 Tax=Eiseniibacteriota bacterium TaxID=2212470 RepID=A0A7Y2E7J8_UNCEI|nr:aldehyde dehydrogenase (NADP(+)) [Candidatus Eisenbacteria bacterium]